MLHACQKSALVGATALCLVAPQVGWADGTTERVSISSAEKQANGFSFNPQLSADGRYASFVTVATNLVTPDANGEVPDVVLRDRRRGVTIRADVSSSGEQANAPAFAPGITRNGRFAAFHSLASNLVSGDTNNVFDVFFRDLRTGRTEIVSTGPGGVPGDAPSFLGGFPANGHFVLINSFASNLDPRTGAGHGNLFLRDRRTGELELLTLGLGGKPADNPPARFGGTVTPDGHYVAFDDLATNLVPHDTNGQPDVVRRDRQTGRTVLVSVAAGGGPANGASTQSDLSDDGDLVFFLSSATNLLRRATTAGRTHCYVRDMRTGKTAAIDRARGGGEANGDCTNVRITPNGRYAAFNSTATDIVADDRNGRPDSFVLDRRTGRVALVDLTAGGRQAEAGVDPSSLPFPGNVSISADGDTVAFVSDGKLVPGDTNGLPDAYVRTGVKELLAKADEAR